VVQNLALFGTLAINACAQPTRSLKVHIHLIQLNSLKSFLNICFAVLIVHEIMDGRVDK
jgi:hypothetical protein